MTATVPQPIVGDLHQKVNRLKLLPVHPMLDRTYALNTRMTDVAYARIAEWFILRKGGLVFHGSPRNGKTYACLRILERLAVDYPFLPTMYMSAERVEDEHKSRFFARQMQAFGFPMSRISSTSSWQRLFCHSLIVKCHEKNSRSILLIWDEAQALSILEFTYLMEVWNTMRNEGYQLCTVLVGQPELKQLMSLSQERGHQAVIGRFFVQDFAFHSIRSSDELHTVLRQYDEDQFYPEGQRDWSYSRFFAMAHFDKGWRLADETAAFWDALGVAQGVGAGDNGYRMAWVTDAIHHFLYSCLVSDRLLPSTKKEWHSAITAVANLNMLR